jgi:hypothetical protein
LGTAAGSLGNLHASTPPTVVSLRSRVWWSRLQNQGPSRRTNPCSHSPRAALRTRFRSDPSESVIRKTPRFAAFRFSGNSLDRESNLRVASGVGRKFSCFRALTRGIYVNISFLQVFFHRRTFPGDRRCMHGNLKKGIPMEFDGLCAGPSFGIAVSNVDVA